MSSFCLGSMLRLNKGAATLCIIPDNSDKHTFISVSVQQALTCWFKISSYTTYLFYGGNWDFYFLQASKCESHIFPHMTSLNLRCYDDAKETSNIAV